MFCTIAKPLFVFQKLRSGTWALKSRATCSFKKSTSVHQIHVHCLFIQEKYRRWSDSHLGRPDNRRTRRRPLKIRSPQSRAGGPAWERPVLVAQAGTHSSDRHQQQGHTAQGLQDQPSVRANALEHCELILLFFH